MKNEKIIAVWRGVNGVGTRIEKRVTGSPEFVDKKIAELIQRFGGSASYSLSQKTKEVTH